MNEHQVFAAINAGRAALCALAFAACSACSAWAAARDARDAESVLRAAEQAQADRRAPYEWTVARLYLAKAREEAGEARYAAARAFLARATHSAERALYLAEHPTRSGR